MKTLKINYTLRIKKGKAVRLYRSSKIRRFRFYIASINCQNQNFRAFLKVNYGNGYYNDGIYETKDDLIFALDAFADPAIPKYLDG